MNALKIILTDLDEFMQRKERKMFQIGAGKWKENRFEAPVSFSLFVLIIYTIFYPGDSFENIFVTVDWDSPKLLTLK